MIDAHYSEMTWYEATANRGSLRQPLSGQLDVDVCVVGGGLAGLTTALELARRGKSVALLEAKRIAWGASGRNGGFVSNGFAWGVSDIARKVGMDAARSLYQLSRHGTEYVRREILEGDPSIKMGEGWLGAIRYDNAAEKREEVEKSIRELGQEKVFLDTGETRALVNTQRYFQSALDPTAFHMHPLRYALMIARNAETGGARLFEMCPAVGVEKDAAGYRVRTAKGEVRCAEVVYCVSALDRNIYPAVGRAVLPVATYVAVTEPLNQDFIRTRHALSDSRRAGNYYRLIDEGRILWGGAITTRVSEPTHLAERMKRDMLSVFPGLGNPKIDYAWAGLMGYTRHFMPLIGTDGQGQWWATAFGGHGMNTTAMGGILMSRAIAAKDDEYKRFRPFTPDWAGGPFGRAAVQAGYWYLQLKDRIDESRSKRAA